jgi:hypothetical protein
MINHIFHLESPGFEASFERCFAVSISVKKQLTLKYSSASSVSSSAPSYVKSFLSFLRQAALNYDSVLNCLQFS